MVSFILRALSFIILYFVERNSYRISFTGQIDTPRNNTVFISRLTGPVCYVLVYITEYILGIHIRKDHENRFFHSLNSSPKGQNATNIKKHCLFGRPGHRVGFEIDNIIKSFLADERRNLFIYNSSIISI